MKVTVVGAGNVGATCANCIAEKDIVNEVVRKQRTSST